MLLAVRVVQNTAAGQMVNGTAKPLAATAPHDYLLALTALFRYRGDAAVSAEGCVISLS